jgi:excisionase family DNA binding protein
MSSVIVVSPQELAIVVETAVRRALDAGASREASEWLDAGAVAKLLGIHRRTVARLAKTGELPSSRIGKLLRFRRSDVVAVLERGGA